MGQRDPYGSKGQAIAPWLNNPFGEVGSLPAGSNTITRDTVFHHMRTATGLVKLLDCSGRIVFANKPCRDTLGRLITNGRYWWDLWPSETHPLVIDALRRASKGETATFTAFRTTGGQSPSWWQVTVQGMSTDSGEIDMIFVTSRDVSPKVGASSVMQRI